MALARVMRMTRVTAAPAGRVLGSMSVHSTAFASAEQDPADFQPLELEDALSNELNFETRSAEGENVTKDELALDVQNAFPDFTASLQPGKTTLKLVRKAGDMDVKVIVDLCTPDLLPGAEEEPEDGADEEDMTMMALRGRVTAHVEGRDSALTVLFHIPTAAESGLEIASAIAHPYGAEDMANDEVGGGQSDDVYAPPNFDDLDFSLQASFVKFLGDCGLDVEFAEGVRSLADRKEQFEYLQWLGRAHAALEGTARA